MPMQWLDVAVAVPLIRTVFQVYSFNACAVGRKWWPYTFSRRMLLVLALLRTQHAGGSNAIVLEFGLKGGDCNQPCKTVADDAARRTVGVRAAGVGRLRIPSACRWRRRPI